MSESHPAVGFPSSAAVARIRELAERLETCKAELAAAARVLTLASKSRDLIEVSGGHPDKTVRNAKAAVDLAKRKMSAARNELTSAFIDEHKLCAKSRADAWVRIYTALVKPRDETIAAALKTFERTVDEITELLRRDSETIRQLDALDAATGKWNALVDGLSGPGNTRLNGTGAAQSLRASFAEIARFVQFETTLKKLRDTLNPPPPPRPPLTEEQISGDREIAAETSLAASSRLQAESEKSRLREETALQSTKAT